MAAALLPSELIDHIVSELAGPPQDMGTFVGPDHYKRYQPLATYATISRAWQQEVERYTFWNLYLTTQRLAALVDRNILAPRRLLCVRMVQLLTGNRVGAGPDVGTWDASDKVAFEYSIRELFRILKPLDFTPQVPVYFALSSRTQYCYSKLQLEFDDEANPLPQLDIFSSLRSSWDQWEIPPAMFCRLASRFNRLEDLAIWFPHDQVRNVAHRRRIRGDLARAIALLPRTLDNFVLSSNYTFTNHYLIPQSLLSIGVTIDPLSAALGARSQQLRDLCVIGLCLDGIDFFDAWLSHGGQTPNMSRMEDFYFNIPAHTPAGSWLVDFDPHSGDSSSSSSDTSIESDDDESDNPRDPIHHYSSRRRRLPNLLVKRLFLAAAKAVEGMPSLKRFIIILDDDTGGGDGCLIDFRVEKKELEVCSKIEYVFDDELVDAWKRSARVAIGESVQLAIRYRVLP
ncbi:hypothetical protein GQ53DRAFT_830871 [Thozetella sp. PMI_491]|nr:hypothetical protein GQ53DRAFT_830871 [Thozetella sp. PMI_491]